MAAIYRQAACLLCMVAVAVLCNILASLSNEAKDTASRVQDTLELWNKKDLQGTVAWRARVMLAGLSWLGPLRPLMPEDPVTSCGLMVEASCPNLPLEAPVTGRLLRCLEGKIKEVEEEHVAFQGTLFYSLFVIFWAVALVVVLLQQYTGRQGGKTLQDRLGVMPPEAEEIDRGLDSDSCDGQFSGEYDDCQEEASLHPPGGGSQATTEDRLCGVPDTAEYCDNLSLDMYEDCGEGITSLPPTDTSQGCQEDVVTSSTVPPPPVSVYPDDYYLNKKKKRREKKATDDDDCVEDNDDGGEWRLMTRKNKEKTKASHHDGTQSTNEAKETPQKMNKNVCPKPSSGASPRTGRGAEQRPQRPAKAQRRPAPTDALREAMRQQWREADTQVLLEVPPHRRRHVIGRGGETVRQMRRTFPDVDVSVPVASDATSGHVVLHGPEKQVAAAAQHITARLKAVEAEVEEARRRREESRPVTAVLEAEPAMRGLIVGPGGERLLRLAQEHPRVRVTVPPPSNTKSRAIKLRGPPGEVAAVKASLEATLQEEQRWREARRVRKPAHKRAPAKK